MKSRLQINPLSSANKQAMTAQTQGLELSEIRYVAPSELSSNSLNSMFPAEKERYFEELAEDVQQRGILVPLIAKRDGTLLAGHNRLQVALKLDLARIPVQYVETVLTRQEEVRFVIADNLFRRHLSNEDKIRLYKHLYENFEERLKLRHDLYKPQDSESEGSEQGVHLVNPPVVTPLTAAIIAKDTGQKVATVQKQLRTFEQQSRRESQQNRRTQEEVAVMSASKSEEMMRAREREADRALKSAVEEIALQLQRTDVSDEWRRSAMQRTLRSMEKTQKLLPA